MSSKKEAKESNKRLITAPEYIFTSSSSDFVHSQTQMFCNPWKRPCHWNRDYGSSTSNSTNGNNNKKNNTNIQDVDLAKELYLLSVEEREEVWNDLHGVGTIREESPEFINDCIEELDRYLANSRHKLLRQALFLRPELEKSAPDNNKAKTFKLMFLRADKYNARKACKRMSNYFDEKCALFGEHNLVKRIAINDLNDDDIQVLQSGLITQLPHKDQSGRPIVLCNLTLADWNKFTPESIIRCFWYVKMNSILDDDDAQRKGICGINFLPQQQQQQPETKLEGNSTTTNPSSSSSSSSSSSFIHLLAKVTMKCGYILSECLPCRLTSHHICYDKGHRFDFILRIIRAASGKLSRLRLRTHIGSDTENEYSLVSFGINCIGVFQAARNGDYSIHKNYIQRRKEKDKLYEQKLREEECRNGGIIAYPNPKDVLIGRGRSFQEYSGNQLWRKMIDDKLEDYQSSKTRSEKTSISMNVVKQVLKSNGRFLEQTKNDNNGDGSSSSSSSSSTSSYSAGIGAVGWKIVDEMNAREKTSVCFRSRNKVFRET